MSCKCENLADKIIKYTDKIQLNKKQDEVFKELNVHNECCRKKIHDAFIRHFLRQQEIKFNKIADINLILVSKKARPAAYLDSLSVNQIRKIKRKYPNLIYEFANPSCIPRKGNYFVSYKKLPIRKKDEDGSVYMGRVLGYQYSVNTKKNRPRYFVRYNALSDKDKIHIYSEGIRFKSHYKSNKEKFAKALKPYGYTVEEVIKKNPRYKN